MKEDEKGGMRNVKKLLDKREATDMAKVAKKLQFKCFHLAIWQPGNLALPSTIRFLRCVILYRWIKQIGDKTQ